MCSELAFTPLIEKMTSKERSQMSSECVFDSEIPHWKIKQLIKQILSKLGVQSLFSQPCYATVKKSLLRLFTNNHHTKLRTASLLHSVKVCRSYKTGIGRLRLTLYVKLHVKTINISPFN